MRISMPKDDNWTLLVNTNLTRLRRDMRKCGSTEEEIERIVSYLPHLKPVRKNRKPSAARGKGKARQWLVDHADYGGGLCLVFPFARNGKTGYGSFGYNGEQLYAHRYMCELVHGPQPTPEHEAGHACGNGHGGCVNPNHLNWITKSENRLDALRHGRGVRGRIKGRYRLTPAQVAEIRSLRGQMTQEAIANKFNISEPRVRAIFAGTIYVDKRQLAAAGAS
jgi:hypothetical protein